ncbi:MAG: LCP family protein [Oscillospiraceae bacterium]|nr:LCP family protein [Oscillospiraceae bacterium]
MDDLFFNDNRDNNRKRRPNGEIYDQSDFENNEVYSDSAFPQSDNGGFKVTIPDEEPSFGSQSQSVPRSRTPSGRPVGAVGNDRGGYNPSGSTNRTPKGRPVGETPNTAYRQGAPSAPPGSTYGSYSSPVPPKKRNILLSAGQDPTDAGRAPVRPVNGPVRRPPVKKQPSPVPSSGGSSGGPNKPKKKSNGKKIAAAIFAVIFILLAAIFAYGYSILGKINYDTDSIKENQYISEKELFSAPGVKNILLIGSDARNEIQGMRSDTMILLSIDNKNKQLKMTSFLRDSYVCIPSTGHWRKLNAACSAGGAQLVIDTIEYNFKVKIDSYVLVDFEVFTKLIDLMGGLKVKGVTEAEAKYLRDKVKITYAKEGTNKFSGAAALWYCRIRYLDDDFHRTERQRKVISAIIDQAKSMNPLELVKIVEQVLPMITTDIGRNDMLNLGVSAILKYSRYDIQQHQIPAKGTWNNRRVSGVGDVLEMDISKNVELLREFISKKQTSEEPSSKK